MPHSKFRIDHKVPITSLEMFSGPYREIPVDRNDERSNEPLIPLESVKVAYESYYAKTDGQNPPFYRAIEGSHKDVWLRKSVAEKLARVNKLLAPYDAELFVLDGYRTVDCQQGLWNFYFEKAKQENPAASEQEHRARAMQFIIDPASFDENDSRTWPAHSSGGAIDLTLRDLTNGELLDMGARFEEDTKTSPADYFECELVAGRIDEGDIRLQNRRLLNWAMTSEGLLNETAKVVWHYDWGNQIYVRASRVFLPNPPTCAWYGYIAAPNE
ncbi:MAG TPA: M15 family metallopeptidase [Pyrinomonadaceae bacterium]